VLIYGPRREGQSRPSDDIARTPWPLPFGLCHNRRRSWRDKTHRGNPLALQVNAAKNQTYIVAIPRRCRSPRSSGIAPGIGRSPFSCLCRLR